MERPIIFNTEMIRAILDGRKTQTRRIIKPQPTWVEKQSVLNGYKIDRVSRCIANNEWKEIKCPYGKVGDKLWVQEEWCVVGDINDKDMREPMWKEMAAFPSMEYWESAKTMPRWASRILLEITNIRVDKLVTLTYDDAIAEGFDSIESFKNYWDILNKKRGFTWQKDPWIWILEFRKV